LEFFNHSCLTFEHYVVAAEITRQLNLFTPLIRIISSVLNIRYQRYMGWQNYILDIGWYIAIWYNTGRQIGRHTNWRIYMWLPT